MYFLQSCMLNDWTMIIDALLYITDRKRAANFNCFILLYFNVYEMIHIL